VAQQGPEWSNDQRRMKAWTEGKDASFSRAGNNGGWNPGTHWSKCCGRIQPIRAVRTKKKGVKKSCLSVPSPSPDSCARSGRWPGGGTRPGSRGRISQEVDEEDTLTKMDIRSWLKKSKSLNRDDASMSQVQPGGAAATGTRPPLSKTPLSPKPVVLDTPPPDGSSKHNSYPDDLGVDKPNQVRLESDPVRHFSGKKHSFSFVWYQNRPWLEYSVQMDAAYCFPCRQFFLTHHHLT